MTASSVSTHYEITVRDHAGHLKTTGFDRITDARLYAVRYLRKNMNASSLTIVKDLGFTKYEIEYITKVRGAGVPNRYISYVLSNGVFHFGITPKEIDPDNGKLGKEYKGMI